VVVTVTGPYYCFQIAHRISNGGPAEPGASKGGAD
jgi:hypothetical protein